MHPVAGEAVARGRRLRELVLVMREAQVEPAAVDVELGAEVAPTHRGALDVPARTARTPRRLPGGVGRFVGLGALPQGEVAGIALAARIRVGGRLHRVDLLMGQGAVRGPRPHVEVHVAGPGP